MRNTYTVNLFHCEGVRISIDINALISPQNGDLVIDGYDFGPTVEEHYGDSDYEYRLTIPAQHKSTLVKLLSADFCEYSTGVNEDVLLLNLLAKYFSNIHAVEQIQVFCKANHIPAKYTYYA